MTPAEKLLQKTLATSGSTPPASSSFPSSTPAKIVNSDGTLSLDALGQLIVPLMPKLGSDLLVEHGSNANGSWYKFADGTMICTWDTNITPTANSNTGKTWTFPVAFIAQPAISVTPNSTGATVSFCGFANPTATNCSLRIVRSNNTSTPLSAMAVGLWK